MDTRHDLCSRLPGMGASSVYLIDGTGAGEIDYKGLRSEMLCVCGGQK
jgi:hypothetical protein